MQANTRKLEEWVMLKTPMLIAMKMSSMRDFGCFLVNIMSHAYQHEDPDLPVDSHFFASVTEYLPGSDPNVFFKDLQRPFLANVYARGPRGLLLSQGQEFRNRQFFLHSRLFAIQQVPNPPPAGTHVVHVNEDHVPDHADYARHYAVLYWKMGFYTSGEEPLPDQMKSVFGDYVGGLGVFVDTLFFAYEGGTERHESYLYCEVRAKTFDSFVLRIPLSYMPRLENYAAIEGYDALRNYTGPGTALESSPYATFRRLVERDIADKLIQQMTDSVPRVPGPLPAGTSIGYGSDRRGNWENDDL